MLLEEAGGRTNVLAKWTVRNDLATNGVVRNPAGCCDTRHGKLPAPAADDALFDVLGTGYALWVRDGNLSRLCYLQRLRSQRDSGNYIYGSITVDF